MSEYAQMKVGDIRSILIEEHGYNENEINEVKGKTALVGLLQKARGEVELVESVNLGNLEPQKEPEDTFQPDETSPEWHDYVMSLFTKDELIAGNPTVDGMRRVVTKLCDTIMDMNTAVVQTPDANNNERATVVVKIILADKQSACGAADAFAGNSTHPYNKHLVSLAETRAEGRAYKRLLGLRRVVAAEELADLQEQEDEKKPATDIQLNFIDKMCCKERLDISIVKLLEQEKYNVKTLKYSQCLKLNELLSNYQSNMDSIPEEIKNYQSNWR